MAEYIEREALFQDIKSSVVFSVRNAPSAEMRGANKIMDRIKCAPAADVAPVVHGRWEIKCESYRSPCGEYDEDFYMECSECGRKVWDINQTDALFGDYEKIIKNYPYCHCGAKMDGDAE